MVASQYANLFHFICSSNDLSTTRFQSNSASANPRGLSLSLLRAFGPQVVNDVLEDLYNHPTGAPSPNEWNNFATVERGSLTSTSPPRSIALTTRSSSAWSDVSDAGARRQGSCEFQN
jgi:hypothetical protein